MENSPEYSWQNCLIVAYKFQTSSSNIAFPFFQLTSKLLKSLSSSLRLSDSELPPARTHQSTSLNPEMSTRFRICEFLLLPGNFTIFLVYFLYDKLATKSILSDLLTCDVLLIYINLIMYASDTVSRSIKNAQSIQRRMESHCQSVFLSKA